MAALGTTDITTTLVNDTTGAGSHVLSTLCTTNINRWSKYKPTRGATGDSTFWKGSDGRCGFNLPIWSSGTTYDPSTWGYIQPNNNYRLGDFRGYYHTNDIAPPFYSNAADYTVRTLDPVENQLVS
jgi:hypothetical protein